MTRELLAIGISGPSGLVPPPRRGLSRLPHAPGRSFPDDEVSSTFADPQSRRQQEVDVFDSVVHPR